MEIDLTKLICRIRHYKGLEAKRMLDAKERKAVFEKVIPLLEERSLRENEAMEIRVFTYFSITKKGMWKLRVFAKDSIKASDCVEGYLKRKGLEAEAVTLLYRETALMPFLLEAKTE